MLVDVGRWQSLEASVGPAEGGEASPPSFAEVLSLHYCLARPATSERGTADIYIYIYIIYIHIYIHILHNTQCKIHDT